MRNDQWGVYPSCAHSRAQADSHAGRRPSQVGQENRGGQDSERASDDVLELLKFFLRLPEDGSQGAVA